MSKSYNNNRYGSSGGSSYGNSRSGGSSSSYGGGGSSYGSGRSGGSSSSYGGGSRNRNNSSYGGNNDFMNGPSYFSGNNNASGGYGSSGAPRNTTNPNNYDSRREAGGANVSNKSDEIRQKIDDRRGEQQSFFAPEGAQLLKYQDLPGNTISFTKPSGMGRSKNKAKKLFKKYSLRFILPLVAVVIGYGGYMFYSENISIELKRNPVGKVEIKSISDEDFINVLRTGTPDEIDRAFSLSPNVDLVDQKGRDIISVAVLNNANDSSIMHLLDHVENVNKKDINGLSPLANAILFHRSEAIIKKIIARGANVNDVSEKGTSVLMTAAAVTDSPEVVKTLISNGADVNYKNSDQVTPLMMAVTTSSNPEIVKVLLGGGADPMAKDSSGRSVLEIAQKNPALINTDVMEIIRKYYQPINQSNTSNILRSSGSTQQNYMNTSNAPTPKSSERTRNGLLPYGQERINGATDSEMSNSPVDINPAAMQSGNSANTNTNQQSNTTNTQSAPSSAPESPLPTQGTPQNSTPSTTQPASGEGTNGATNGGLSFKTPNKSNKNEDLIISNDKPNELVASEVRAKRKGKYLEYSKAYDTGNTDVDQAGLKEEEVQYIDNKDMENYLTQEEEANRNYSRYTRPDDRDYSF